MKELKVGDYVVFPVSAGFSAHHFRICADTKDVQAVRLLH
jgi:hypothetical protein